MNSDDKKKKVAAIMADYRRDVKAVEEDLARALRKIHEKVTARKLRELHKKIQAHV